MKPVLTHPSKGSAEPTAVPKSISTLVKDIYAYLDGNAKIDPQRVKVLGDRLAETITERLTNGNQTPELRMSNFGTKCDRQLWYRIKCPTEAEPLDGKARFKFLFGDILEDVVLVLAEEAGHRVTGRQTTLELAGIKGHRDAVIDGVLVDVKSANARSFTKFEKHELEEDDPFGYLTQIGLYSAASKDDPLVEVKGEHAFLAVDKELGTLVVDKYKIDRSRDWEKEIREKRQVLERTDPPARGYSDVPDGASGNRKLGVACSYCPFKHKCWPGLRTFQYSNGRRHLTVVEREPEVKEVTK